MAALGRELEAVSKHPGMHDIRTVYFGGGTPSCIPTGLIREFCQHIYEVTGAAGHLIEFSMEVNPEDVTEANVDAWMECGVTRFSMGVQSMLPNELHAIGRRHTPQRVAEAAAMLRSKADLSLDLICGLPHQTLQSFSESLEVILALRPHHVSVYMLELEKESALRRLMDSRKICLPSETDIEDMYLYMCARLSQSGFQQYEISNFALPGHESRHNSHYWDGTPYIGLGPSAASYPFPDTRRVCTSDIDSYIANGATYETEHLSDIQRQEEYILTRLRTYDGISIREFAEKFGIKAAESLQQRATSDIQERLLIHDNDHLRLSFPKACLLSDAIMVRLLP